MEIARRGARCIRTDIKRALGKPEPVGRLIEQRLLRTATFHAVGQVHAFGGLFQTKLR